MRDEPPIYDAVVVGARAAGAGTAQLLARFGLSVLLVDRGCYGTDTLSTHALLRGGVLQLLRWGLLDQVVGAGTPAVHRTTFNYAGGSVPITLKPSYGVEALYAPRRTVLDPILVDAAAASGVDVRFGITVTDVLRDGRGAVAGVAGRTSAGRRFAARGRVVIGADGWRSTIARLVGSEIERLGASASAATYGYWRGLDVEGYEWNYRGGMASGAIPTNDGLVCIFAAAPPERLGCGGLESVAEIVAATSTALAERMATTSPPASTRTFRGLRGFLRRSWGPGWALVGDAGYFKDPLSAHGLTDALRDAELLARAVRAVVHDGAPDDVALASYQATRDALSAELFEAIDAVAGHRWTDEEIPALLRRMTAATGDEVELLAALPPIPPLPRRSAEPAAARA